MGRYFFHTKDRHFFADGEGTDLNDFDAAKVAAIQLLGEILRDQPKLFWETEDFTVTVTDDASLVLFTLDLSATVAPAIPKRC